LSVFVEHAFDVGQEHQQIGAHERYDHGRELIVVTEADFVGRDRVVFVDDRHCARVEQRAQRFARVVQAFAIGEIGVGEQDLRGGEPDFAEGFVVAAHQHALAGGGRGLELRHLFRLGLVAEPVPAERDRAAGDHDGAALVLSELGYLAREPRRKFRIVRDRSRSNFDDQAPGLQKFGTNGHARSLA